MSMNDDFGKSRGEVGSDNSQTAEDATLRGQPIEEAPGVRDLGPDDAESEG